ADYCGYSGCTNRHVGSGPAEDSYSSGNNGNPYTPVSCFIRAHPCMGFRLQNGCVLLGKAKQQSGWVLYWSGILDARQSRAMLTSNARETSTARQGRS